MGLNIEKLLELGNEWKAGDKHRIYFNDWHELAGLKIDRYKSGGIASATWQGHSISNKHAASLIGGKIYYDVVTGKFFMSGFADTSSAQDAINEIRKLAAEEDA